MAPVAEMTTSAVSVEDAGRALGVSVSTIWRMIRRGELPSIRQGGRRRVPAAALRRRPARIRGRDVPPLTPDHPIFRLVGAGHGGRHGPGARDKHAIVDR